MELKHCPFCGSDAKLMKESNTHCNCSNKDCLLYGDRYFHIDKWNKRQEVSTPTKENILEVLMDSNFYKKVGLYYSPEDFSMDVKKLVNDLHALLMSGNVKEPQWPKKVYTYKSLPSRKDYRTGFNAARDLCKQAWKDEKERTPGIPGKQDKYV